MNDSRITPQAKRDAHIHYIGAFMGGFLGLFPILNIVHLFGSSQTTNLIEIILCFFGRNWTDAGYHVAGSCLYILGVFLATYLPSRSKIDVKSLSALINVVTAFVMWKMPDNLPKTIYLYPTFFAMSFQWTAFTGSYGFTPSTIFSTNNLKQVVSAFTEVYCNGKKEFLLKARFFGATMIAYHLGVICSIVLWSLCGNLGFLFVIIPAAAVLIANRI